MGPRHQGPAHPQRTPCTVGWRTAHRGAVPERGTVAVAAEQLNLVRVDFGVARSHPMREAVPAQRTQFKHRS